MAKITIGADTETYDPLLKKQGYSWKYGQGHILCTALYYEEEDRIEVIAGIHNDNCPFTRIQRLEQNQKIRALLTNPDVRLVGANITYDIAWWLYELGMSTYEVKCSFIDVLIAERFLNEFDTPDLEKLSWQYLKYGKAKQKVEAWIHENISRRGDFRQYLKDAPWELTDEYVRGDAKNPVKIWRKQLTLLKEQNLCQRVKLEFDILLPALQMTMYGLPIDEKKKKENYEYLSSVVKKFRAEFIAKYNLPNFRVTASRDVASFLDSHNIPYNYMITLTGKDGVKFRNGDETDDAYRKAKQLVTQFRLKKGKPVAYVPKEMAERTVELLKEEGFMCNSSPNLDKKYREAKREGYPEVALIDDWKKANDICSKILGDAYNRFYAKNFKGETCVKPQIKTADTKTHRMSENMPNCLAGNMRVLTPKGWIRIDKLSIGDSIYNGNGDITTVKNIWDKGVQNCLLTVCANGYRIVTTPEHKIWTGEEEKEVIGCEQIGVIERRADCKAISLYADKRANSRCTLDKQKYSNECVEETAYRERAQGAEDTTQNTYSESLHRPTRRTFLCKRIYITGKTLFQRALYKIQSFSEQREKLSEEVSYRRAEKRATQPQGSSSSIQAKWSYRKASTKLQRYLYGLRRICYCLYYSYRRRDKQSKVEQESICRSTRLGCTPTSTSNGCTPYRHQPLKQRLGQLSTLYEVSTQKVTQTVTRARKVYDIEVASEDHSFICEGFRVFNCQQIPSKNGIKVHNEQGEEVEISFPKITRALFKASEGCVFGKIDYGQIEYRLICNIACGESGKEVRRQYAENPHLDFHQYVVDLTGLSRKYAKNMSFGVSFGMGLPSMAENFGWTLEHAEEIAEAYHSKMPFVAPTLALVGDTAKDRGYIRTAYGAHARLKDKKKAYSMLNRYTQESGAEAMKCAIRQSYQEGVFERLKTSNVVHDELNFPYLEPTEEQMIDLYRMAQIMREAIPNLRVPLEASPELGDNWASTKEVTEWIELRDKNDEAWIKASGNLKKAVNICDKLLKEGRVAV